MTDFAKSVATIGFGFCRLVSSKVFAGALALRFVERVLEERDLEVDSELQEAREFVGRIWAKAKP